MTTDLRARAEELLTENADADRPDPRSWMDAADRIIRDLLAALPPDPVPTGERRPCAGWRRDEYGTEEHLSVGPYRLIVGAVAWAVHVEASLDDLHQHGPRMGERVTTRYQERIASGIETSTDAAKVTAEDLAAELLRAGLRALGRVK